MSNPTWISKDLGPVDAYAMAVSLGYTGTHAEFVQQMFHTKDYSETSEKYAVGQVNGTDVDSSDPAYHNNSKYYSEQAGTEASTAHSERLLAEAALLQAEQALSLDVAAWLEDNMSNPDSPSLDRTLKLSLAAAPADLTGNLQRLFYKEVKKLNVATYSISTWDSDHKIKLEGDSGIGSIIFANGWKVSEKISMEGIAQLQIYRGPAAGSAVAYIVYYDESDNYLNHEEMPGGTSGEAAREVPNNTDYVRISSNISNNSYITVKRGTTEDGAIYTALAEKADKVTSATSGNFAALDSNGNLTDSGHKHSDYGTYSKPSGGIPSTDMASAVQTSLGKADSAYQKPSGGIPSTDMASAVQTSLGKADTAYQKPSGGIPGTDLASSYIEEPSSDGTNGQVLTTDGSGGRTWTTVQGGGTSDYSQLSNKPQINSVTLSGNKSLSDLGIAAASAIPDITGKADKVTSATNGHLAALDSNGNLTDSGKAASDFGTYSKPSGGIPGTDLANDYIEEPSSEGTNGQVLTTDGNGGRSWTTVQGGSTVTLNYVTPEDYGAVGDGTTDDSDAVQDAVDAGYDVYFAGGKTYYLASTVMIDHDCHLFGGEGATIKTVTPSGGTANDAIVITGTLKKTTTLTTDYSSTGATDNSGNQFTLSDMTDINVGDLLVIEASDQYYNYSRAYYHLGATLVIGDTYDGHLYTTDSLPYDIENTENVSVKVYSAPTAVIENLNFVSDLDSRGNYIYCLKLNWCKNSIIRNCTLSQMDNGIRVYECVNTLIDCVNISKSKYDNTLSGDGYGIGIYSSSETIVQRVESICAQTCITLSGTITNINTFIRNCNIASECRANSIGSHENCYNTVIEDCVVAQINVLGTAEINRCRFIKNNRISASTGITFCGSHNPDWAVLKVRECTFEDPSALIYLYASTPQDPVQSFDNIFGLVEISNCDGGKISFTGTTSATILSNRIKQLNMYKWTNCYEFYRPSSSTDIIEKMNVSDCTFGKAYWISDHNDAHGMVLENIYDLDYRSTIPANHKVSVSKSVYAERYALPGNVSISLSATNSTTAKYVVCGNNVAPNEPDDWVIGTVSGSDGGTLSRAASTSSSKPVITKDNDGNIVHTQQNNSSSYDMYPVGLFYVREACTVKMSATLKNTGSTTGATFRPLIAVVNCETGKLVSRYSGTAVQATSGGASISYEHAVSANCVAMCYFYCNSAVANAETTFESHKAYIANNFAPVTADSINQYEARRRTGDGTVLSLDGTNNIMSSETTFNVSFAADFVDNPIGLLPSGTGVSF